MNITHDQLVAKLVKPGVVILQEQSPEQAHLQHMGIGICGEAGELIDAIKKNTIYQKPLDRANVIEELGDLEFYMEGVRQALEITREECITGNITKLSKRYESLSYSNESAINREDKK